MELSELKKIMRTWRTLQAICACHQICSLSTWYLEISIIIIQHLFSALFTNKYALMRYLKLK